MELIFKGFILLGVFVFCTAWNDNGENCQSTPSGDTCDPSKYLTCKNSRCECFDTSTQVFSSIRVEAPANQGRKKRSPKNKIGGGHLAAGGAGLAGGALIGYEVSKLSQSGSQSSSGGGGGNGGGDHHRRKNMIEITSCFSRISAPCVLDSSIYNVAYSVQGVPTPNLVQNNTSNSTLSSPPVTSTPHPSSTVNVKPLDLLKLPKCVEFATCKPNSGRFGDTHVGECVCNEGYKRTTKDICEKDTSKPAKNSVQSRLEPLYAIILGIFGYLLL